ADGFLQRDLEQLALQRLAGLGLVAPLLAADQQRPGVAVLAEAEPDLFGAEVAESAAGQLDLAARLGLGDIVIVAENAEDGTFVDDADRAGRVIDQAHRHGPAL